MPIFITNGNINALHQMSYGNVTPTTIGFLQNQLSIIQNTPQLQGYYETAKLQFEAINGDTANRIADAVIRNNVAMYNPNVITCLSTIEQLQLAPVIMQRWLMTDPYIREQANNNRIYAWKDTYVDYEPELLPHERRDYRLLNQGLIETIEDGDWLAKQYFESYDENEKPLTISERIDILDSIAYAKAYIEEMEEDPTSPFGDLM